MNDLLNPALVLLLREAVRAELGPELDRLCAEVETLRGALPPLLVPVDVAGERLGVSARTVTRRIRSGEIPVKRIGRRVLVDLGGLRGLDGGSVAALARAARNGDS